MSKLFQQYFGAGPGDARPARNSNRFQMPQFKIQVPRSMVHRAVALFGVAGVIAGLSGCGDNLRPTVTPITGTGPASQPLSYAFVVSAPTTSPTAQGYATVIDYSGDTIMATAAAGPSPKTFAINTGTLGWTLNEDGTVSNIPISTQLQEKNITYSTLNPIPAVGTPTDPAGLDPVVGLFGGSLGLYALDVNLNELDVLTGVSRCVQAGYSGGSDSDNCGRRRWGPPHLYDQPDNPVFDAGYPRRQAGGWRRGLFYRSAFRRSGWPDRYRGRRRLLRRIPSHRISRWASVRIMRSELRTRGAFTY